MKEIMVDIKKLNFDAVLILSKKFEEEIKNQLFARHCTGCNMEYLHIETNSANGF